MQLQINKLAILKALSNVNGAVEKRNTIPVLLNVKIEAKSGKLYLTATDMDIVIISDVEAIINKEGCTTIPAQLFYDIIRKIPDEAQININLESDNGNIIKISYNKSQFSLPTIDPDDFPVLSEGDMETSFSVKGKEFSNIIDKVRLAIPGDEARLYLNGMFLHSIVNNNDVELRGVATDGHRLALSYSKESNLNQTIDGIIIPKKTVAEIRKIIKEDEDILISFSKSKIKVISGSSTIISKLIDGQFPEYERIIPKSNDKRIIVNRKSIFDAIDRVATITTDKNKPIKLTLEENKIIVQSKTNDNGNAIEEIEVDFCSEPIEIGFNSRYFLDIIGQIDRENISFYFKDGISPVLVKSDDNSSLYVIMPIRV